MTYTSHGHHIPGTTRDDEHGQVNKIRCGGAGICTTCSKEASAHVAHMAGLTPSDAENFFENTSEYTQDPDRFMKQAKLFVIGAYNNTVEDELNQLSVEDLYIVFFTYTLGNWKAMISTSRPGDGLYFEVTHNASGEKGPETYVDTYVKVSNDKFSQEGQ